MRILVLGGTRFAGRALVDQAVSRGHDVTTFTRGEHGEPRPGAEALHGDRTKPEDLRTLGARDWDAVIDVSAAAPVHVTAAATLLAGHARHYTYLSSLAVYTGGAAGPLTEDSPVHDTPADATGTAASLGYGPLKAGGERAVAAAFPGRHLIVRASPLTGPHDQDGGLPWWLTRLATGGEVLAPGRPDRPVLLTDARDLAAWIVDSIRRRIAGVVNVPGPGGSTFGGLLALGQETVRAQAAAPATLVWTPDDVLLAEGVTPGADLPLWTPDPPGTPVVSGDRAQLAGLRYRALADTVHDTWGWLATQPHGTPPGLDPTRERRILSHR